MTLFWRILWWKMSCGLKRNWAAFISYFNSQCFCTWASLNMIILIYFNIIIILNIPLCDMKLLLDLCTQFKNCKFLTLYEGKKRINFWADRTVKLGSLYRKKVRRKWQKKTLAIQLKWLNMIRQSNFYQNPFYFKNKDSISVSTLSLWKYI